MYRKHFLLAGIALILAGAADATAAGFYLGGQIGESNIHNPNFNQGNLATPKLDNKGIAGRVFMGYNINPFFGMELGSTEYASSTYSSAGQKTHTRENSGDFTLKAMLPVSNTGLGFFAKGGASYINRTGIFAENNTDGNSTHTITPTYGAGISFDITPQWVTDISWSRAAKTGDLPNADFVGLSLSYHFVDTYCGQFLC